MTKILNLSPERNEFEFRIFQESFKSSKVVLIWNGFDEISPNYNEFILNIFKVIHIDTKNVQLVCTRPLYSDQLNKVFKIRTWQLVPFNENEKEEFLREFFAFQKVLTEKVTENIRRAEEIIKNLTFQKYRYNYLFNTPLMLKLVADIHEDENLFNNPNIYGIFEIFVDKKIEMWLERSKSTLSIAKKIILARVRFDL